MQSFKLGISALVLASLCVALSAREVSYQNTSNADLIKLAGKVAPEEKPDYAMEIYKRAEKMNPKQRKEFYREVIAIADKSVANAVIKNISKRMEALSAWQSNNYFFK
ncbi:DUF1104 domain-containing protein [Helicobacter bizzozeronii]|uniref:DUF1104 domain-containing protein n=1 Tax=Helicobacter bizzozeronii TaxID=56877 RepID=UPI000CF0FC6C|nr:DUF1104 domain-containing protein [Helicobacter bizzozeronii]